MFAGTAGAAAGPRSRSAVVRWQSQNLCWSAAADSRANGCRVGRRGSLSTHSSEESSYGRGLLIGIGYGLGMAVIFSAFVGVMAVIRGSTHYDDPPTSTLQIIRSYFIAGTLGGALFGVLRPIARIGRLGAVLVGLVIGPFVYGAVGIAVGLTAGFASASTIIPGLIVGGALGFQLGKRPL